MRERAERESDFKRRVASGDDVFVFGDTKYIPVNPFSDDVSLLATIGAPSSQCTKVDAYWSVLEDVAFVQVTSVSPNWLPVGCYRRWGPNGLNLVSVVSERTITRATFERELAHWLDSGGVLDGLRRGAVLGETLTRLDV